jgi:hypothetical protein
MFYPFNEALEYLHFLLWLKSENSRLQINPSYIFEITSHLYTIYKKNLNFSNITKIPFNVYLSFFKGIHQNKHKLHITSY